MNEAGEKILRELGIDDIKATMLIEELNFEQRKLIEIVRAIYSNPDILIVDETSTALSQKGRKLLYDIIDNLKENNKTVIFISHDLDEVFQVCDTVSILRDGIHIKTTSIKEITEDQMRRLMVGRDIEGGYYRSSFEPSNLGILALECNNLYTRHLKNIDLQLKWGEVLGIAGLTDSGMRELGQAIFGLINIVHGSVSVFNKLGENKRVIRNTQQAIDNKIGYVSKNRDKEALMLLSSIKENIVLPSLDFLKTGIYVSPKKERKMADKYSKQMEVVMQNTDQLAIHLSGGNKQKVVLAKWLANKSEILVLDCPTGIDVGVKSSIYSMISEWKKEGKAIIMISEELPEIIGMSDRVLVFKNGEINKEFIRSTEMTEHALIQYMI